MANILRKIIENDKGEIKKLEKTAKKVESYADAMAALSDEAKEMDADAVIGVKYGSSQVMSGAAEVIAYGTAVKYK